MWSRPRLQEAARCRAFVALLREDAIYTMPPVAQWYSGRDAIRAFFAWAWKFYSGCRLIPTSANGQPAFAAYTRMDADPLWKAHSIHLPELDRDRIVRLTLFVKPGGPELFSAFGLPQILPDGAVSVPMPAHQPQYPSK